METDRRQQPAWGAEPSDVILPTENGRAIGVAVLRFQSAQAAKGACVGGAGLPLDQQHRLQTELLRSYHNRARSWESPVFCRALIVTQSPGLGKIYGCVSI